MSWWQILLVPFALLIDLITRLRNGLYDRGVLNAFAFETNLVVIGNLSMGGSGKTPFTCYLIDFLKKSNLQVTTLSRGYRRKTSGFRLAGALDNAVTMGDEPFQYRLRHGDQVGVAVGEDRVLSIPDILFYRPQTDVILLDDAFQQRALAPSFSILLTRYDCPFYADWIFPMGTLREQRSNASRADVIIVSNCPASLSESEMQTIRVRANRYSDAPVFFTKVNYESPVSFGVGELKRKVIGISGIANPSPFEQHLKQNYQVKMAHRYLDHHRYTSEDVRAILAEMDDETSLITTEKDYAKLVAFPELASASCFYIPIEIQFLRDEALFQSLLMERIKNYHLEIISD